MDYAAFIRLLETNGFAFTETQDETAHSLLSIQQRSIFIGDELISVYEYDSTEAMLEDASAISPNGASIRRPAQGDDLLMTNVSWASDPYWFKSTRIIVNYAGEDTRIIEFLKENLDFFAGHGFN